MGFTTLELAIILLAVINGVVIGLGICITINTRS